MKRKLIIVGNQKFMMKDIFELSDLEVDQVKRFMEDDHKDMPDIMKKLIKSDLSEKQKILAGYIMGNTYGILQARDSENVIRGDRDIRPVGM